MVRKIIFYCLYYSGVAHLMLFTNILRGRIPIVLFHRVSPEPDPCWPPLTPSSFENTIKLLSKHYHLYSLDELLCSSKPSTRACCIVFDDGFYDFKEYAFPVLLKYGVPVTLFIPTNNITNNQPIWTSEIDSILLGADKNKDGTLLEIENKKILLRLKRDKDLFKTAASIKNLLLLTSPDDRNLIIKKIRSKIGSNQEQHYRLLSWTDVDEMKAAHPDLFTVESHTHTHPFLPSLNPEDLESELLIARDILKERNIVPADKIAYPIGGYDNKTLEATARYYKFGFAVKNRSVNLKSLNQTFYKYKIPRYNIHTEQPEETFMFINGFHSALKNRLGFLFRYLFN